MRNKEDYPYMEVPQDWTVIIWALVDTVDSILERYGLPLDTVDYYQIKSKYNQLRVYWCIPVLFELDCDDEKYKIYDTASIVIGRVIAKCEKYVDYLVKNNLITKES